MKVASLFTGVGALPPDFYSGACLVITHEEQSELPVRESPAATHRALVRSESPSSIAGGKQARGPGRWL